MDDRSVVMDYKVHAICSMKLFSSQLGLLLDVMLYFCGYLGH